MSAIAAMGAERAEAQTVIDVARELGPIFARRADERTNEDEFVADNYESLRESGLIEAGVASWAAAAPASTSSPQCCERWPITAGRPLLPSPCTHTRSRFRPGDGNIKRSPPWSRC